MKKPCPHVLVNSVNQTMFCKHCGGKQSLSIIIGKPLKDAAKIMNGFVAVHRECEEK